MWFDWNVKCLETESGDPRAARMPEKRCALISVLVKKERVEDVILSSLQKKKYIYINKVKWKN